MFSRVSAEELASQFSRIYMGILSQTIRSLIPNFHFKKIDKTIYEDSFSPDFASDDSPTFKI